MALLPGVGCRQIKLSGKTTGSNSGLKRLRLTGKEDLEGTKKEVRPERKAEGLKREAEREIKEETRPKREAKGEEETEQRDSILPRVSRVTYWQIFPFFSLHFCCYFLF